MRPGAVPLAGGEPVELLDRDESLRALEAALERARTGRGEIVTVTGDAGIGKTTLVRRFLTALPAGIHAFGGVCDDLVTPRPLGPFHDIGRQLGGELGILVREGATPERLQHTLLDLLGGLPPPVVMVLEDLHWADEATVDVVTVLGRRITQRPMLLVLTYRDIDVDADHPLMRVLGTLPPRHVTPVRLNPLSAPAVASLAAGRDIDTTRLYEVTGGNPFYVTEVLAGSGLDVPPTVAYAVTARVAQLPRRTRELLQLLSLVPSRVDTSLVAALRPDWQVALAPAEAIGMIELRDGSLSFRHELARQAVAQQVSAIVARGLHAQILAVSTELGGDPAELVHHAAAAGDQAAVARHAPAAAEAAHLAEAHREAVAQYERALALEDRLEPARAAELWLGLARARMAAEHSELEALDAARRGVQLARTLADELALGRGLAAMSRIASWAGDNRLARELVDEAVHVLEPAGDSPEHAQAMAAAAYVSLAQWDVAKAADWAARAEEMASRVGDGRTAVLADAFLGVTDIAQARSAARLEAAVRTALDQGDGLVAVEGLMLAATTYALRRAHADALEFVARGLAVATAHEYTSWGVYLRVLRTQVLFELGRWQEADADLASAFATMSTQGWARAAALCMRGRLGVRRGEPTAGADLEAAWELAGGSGVPQLCVPVAAGLGELAWLEGRTDRPRPELLEVAASPEVQRWPAVAGELGVWLDRTGGDPGDVEGMARPHRLLIQRRYAEAAIAWRERGCAYEAAEAAILADDASSIASGLAVLDELGAEPLARHARGRLRALGAPVPRRPLATTRQHPAGLTRRQAEVLDLLVTGATNAEIAEELVLSVRTVDHHVAAILQRLGVASRKDAARRAAELSVG
jgi:DNA-binding CsgD family transcriptional regulator